MSAAIRVVVVAGPTAVGKTDLAVRIAEDFDGEVVSADAFQIYRGLDIGTAKVGTEEARRIPHHCVDIADPDEHFDAARYGRAAAAAIDDVHGRGKLPVVAGGSGFYIRALIEGLAPLPSQEPEWRSALEAVERRRGTAFLARMMERLDPAWAESVGEADSQRLMRGLEVTLREGRPMSALIAERGTEEPPYRPAWVALTMPRPLLYGRIERRVDTMLDDGWLDEVRGLRDAGYGRDAPGLRAIGYRELGACLDGEIEVEEARELIARHTRRYAKRQLTWFRGQTPATWYELDDEREQTRRALTEKVLERLRERLTC